MHKSGSEGKGRLLVVDDDRVSLDVIAALLGSAGYQILRASSREQALELLSSSPHSPQPLHAILVDLRMPGLSSPKFAARVRALPARCPQLIAMSATPAEPSAWEGFDRFLLKPASLENLLAVLAGVGPGREFPARSRTKTPARQTSARKNRDSIDSAVLGKLGKAMSPDALQELYRACLTDSRSRIRKLRQLVEDGRADEIRREAHQIKGAAAMVGTTRLAAFAASLEMGSYDKENSLGYLEEMASECDRIERMLLAGLLDD